LRSSSPAVKIWDQDATKRISAADLAAALTAKKKTDARFSADAFLSRPAASARAQADTLDVTDADIHDVVRA
jgi:hypothetical protein